VPRGAFFDTSMVVTATPVVPGTLLFARGVVALLVHTALAASAEPPLNPILFMGGLGASMMNADVDKELSRWYCYKKVLDYKLWLYFENFWPLSENCWRDNIALRWNNGKIKDFGVKVKLVGDNRSEGTDISFGFAKDLWSDLLSGIADLGYNGNSPSVGALHYDWRLGPLELAADGTFAKHKRAIETFVAKAFGKRAVLVTLSYASTLMHKFLATFVDAAWKREHIERWISLSGTFGGAAMLTRMAFYPTPGDFYNMPYLPYISLESCRDLGNTFPSTFVQRPTYKGADEVLLSAAGRSYTSGDIGDALVDAGLLDAKTVFESTQDAYIFDNIDAPGVTVDCFYGIGDDTVTTIHYGNGFNQEATEYSYEDGDGVAPKRSLGRCLEWNSTSVRALSAAPGDSSTSCSVSIYEFPKIGHGGTLHIKEVVETFSRIIHNLQLGNSGTAQSRKGANVMAYV